MLFIHRLPHLSMRLLEAPVNRRADLAHGLSNPWRLYPASCLQLAHLSLTWLTYILYA